MITIAKRRKLSMETRLKIGASLKGRIFSAKTLAKFRANRLGYIHSEETKAKISDLALGRKHSKKTIDKIVASRIGRKHSEKTLAKLKESSGFRRDAIEIIDTETGIRSKYESKSEAIKAMGVARATLVKYINSKELLKKRFQILALDTSAKLEKSMVGFRKKAVEVIDIETGIKYKYESATEAAKAMDVSVPTLSKYIKLKKLLKKRFHIFFPSLRIKSLTTINLR
jgi:hypothetical protein